MMAKPLTNGYLEPRDENVKQVTLLLDELSADLSKGKLQPDKQAALLENLKVLGRNLKNAEPIFTKRGIETLARYGFDDGRPIAVSREALRCLANALLLSPPTRQLLIDLGYGSKAAERLKADNVEDEFLASRILFLLTYDTKLDFKGLVSEHQLADSITQCILRHSQREFGNSQKGALSPSIIEMALSETLKLTFNILHFNEDLTGSFEEAISPILALILRAELLHPPLQPPVNHLINSLIAMNLEDSNCNESARKALFPQQDEASNIDRFIKILRTTLAEHPESDDQITPVIAIIRKVYAIAPTTVKSHVRGLLLPEHNDRIKPLGKTDSLPSRLLNITSSTANITLRESILALMFEMSDKDAGKFTENVGYGFAAGFLANNHIPVPENVSKAWRMHGDSRDEDEEDILVNPITGQRLDAEAEASGPPMTQEEKEREAERLFVLFERLKRTGIMDVKNPVEEAIEQGRFEELD